MVKDPASATKYLTANRPRSRRRYRWRLSYEARFLLASIMAGLPAIILAIWLLWLGDYSTKTQWTLTVIIFCCWLGFTASLRTRVIFPLQTLANLLAAIREGDYSIRARERVKSDARSDVHFDALTEVLHEVNELGNVLRRQRIGAMEASALLRAVMAEIDVAIFAFDESNRLKLTNSAGERLLAQPVERLLGSTSEELFLDDYLSDESVQVSQATFPGGSGRWGIRRSFFRDNGVPHQLLVIADLSRELRDEERQAWLRLVRVLGHELNNSLAPIKSLAGSLESLLDRSQQPHDLDQDMRHGLKIIGARADSLSRFMQAYSKLARLPPPTLRPLEIRSLVLRVVSFETRSKVRIGSGHELIFSADEAQLEQLLINLIRNGVDATLETGGGVEVRWRMLTKSQLELVVEDEGVGVANTANLFVPFFTTKQHGTGIGLVLSRQIAEAHGGSLTLENRTDIQGCIARLRLPL
ncbi:MAG: sensor histidine kinase [Pyrinomonadaceae bacterium]